MLGRKNVLMKLKNAACETDMSHEAYGEDAIPKDMFV